MLPPLELKWSARARLVGLAFLGAMIALTAWAGVHPGSSALTPWLAGAFALGLGAQVASMSVFRVRVDDHGLVRRTLRGEQTLAWKDIDAALLVATRAIDDVIVHAHTPDPAAAFHLLLYPRGGARRWHFHRWMTDFPALVAAVDARGLLTHRPPVAAAPSRGQQFAAGVAAKVVRLNRLGAQVQRWFALVFVLLVAGVSLIAGLDLRITGNILVDLLLTALALLGAVLGLSYALAAIGGAHPRSRHDWPLEAAALVGGVLLVAGFLPRALDHAGEHPWLDAIFAAVGAMLVWVALRIWLRGA